MYYKIEQNFAALQHADGWRGTLAVLTSAQAAALGLAMLPYKAGLPALQSVHFCRVQTEPQGAFGALALPKTGASRGVDGLLFYLWDGNLLLVDDSGAAQKGIAHIRKEHVGTTRTAGMVLCEFLLFLTHDQPTLLEHLAARAEHLENEVLEGGVRDFEGKMLALRRTLAAYAHFYTGLDDVVSLLSPNLDEVFAPKETRLLTLAGERIDRLREQAHMLRDYAMQLREVYQAQIDMGQNKIMRVLTVVTTLFLPLTLVAGWYGMNFPNMPLLHRWYGYPLICAVSAALVVFCMWYFRRKKFW